MRGKTSRENCLYVVRERGRRFRLKAKKGEKYKT